MVEAVASYVMQRCLTKAIGSDIKSFVGLGTLSVSTHIYIYMQKLVTDDDILSGYVTLILYT